MRALSPEAVAALASPHAPVCLLIRMDLTDPVFVTTADANIEHDGETWLGVSLVGSIEPITDSVGDQSALSFTLSSVPNDVLALALESANEARGKRCRIYLHIYDPATMEPLFTELFWSGTLDQMTISEGRDSGSVSVKAEHRSVTFGRPKPVRYTDADQRRLFPGDKSLQYIVSQSAHQDVWPSAEWGKK